MSSSATDARVRVISECLNKGFSNNQIASHLGVTPSAVTQLVQEYGIERLPEAKAVGIDEKLDSVEELLVNKLHSRLQNPNSQLNEMQIGNLLRTVNSCKRRSEGAQAASLTQVNNVVNIHLPAYVVKNIIVNAQNELLEIDGKPLISLPANEVEKMFSGSPEDAHIIEEGKPHETYPLEGL